MKERHCYEASLKGFISWISLTCRYLSFISSWPYVHKGKTELKKLSKILRFMSVYRSSASMKIINITIDVCRRRNNGLGNGWILKKNLKYYFTITNCLCKKQLTTLNTLCWINLAKRRWRYLCENIDKYS